MVHALHEAWRVLRPNSYVIDLRPTSESGRVGLLQAARFTAIAETEEDLEDFRAADAALAQAKDLELFDRCFTSRFPLITTFSSPEDLREWLHDFHESMPVASSEKLVRRVEESIKVQQTSAKIVAVVPFILSVLQKPSARPHSNTSLSDA